jgi:hypothetical protein
MLAVAASTTMLIGAPLNAGYDCSSYLSDYATAVNEIDYTSRRYIRCIEGSGGADDCSSEFRRLKNAQSDFETAVSGISSYCKN